MATIINMHSITLDVVLEKAAGTQRELDNSKLFHQFTMEAFTEIGFGLELGCLGSDEIHPFEAAFDDAQHVIMTRMQLPTFVWKLQRLLSIGLEGYLKKCIALVNETVITIIKKTMANAQKLQQQGESATTKRKDIVSLFLESENSKGRLSALLLRDIVLNLLLGGRDTSAEALSWLFYCLSQNPEVEHKIRREITGKLGDSIDVNAQLSIDALQNLTYLEAALKETLRLFPAANFNMRYCYEDVVMSDGTFIPAGCYAVICPFTTGRRTDVWGPDAREFKPERWLDESGKLLPVSSFKFNSFLGGPRACIGMNLAMMQMKTVVVKTLHKFHLAVSEDQTVTYRHAITLPMKDGMRVRVERL